MIERQSATIKKWLMDDSFRKLAAKNRMDSTFRPRRGLR
jgi:hypothetical protein